MATQKTELVVIGAGQMRTGTNSLKLALEKLYGKKCYHMKEIVENHKEHMALWIKALDENYLDKSYCDILFQEYYCTVDNPAAPFYKDLMRIYPNAKVILTTRNTDEGLKSVRQTALRKDQQIRFFHKLIIPLQILELVDKLTVRVYHAPMDHISDESLKNGFETFNEEVRKYVPKEKLLEFNIKEGWEPLCKFLNIETIPSEPFPFVNTTDEYWKYVRTVLWNIIVKKSSVLAVCGIIFAIGAYVLKNYYDPQ